MAGAALDTAGAVELDGAVVLLLDSGAATLPALDCPVLDCPVLDCPVLDCPVLDCIELADEEVSISTLLELPPVATQAERPTAIAAHDIALAQSIKQALLPVINKIADPTNL